MSLWRWLTSKRRWDSSDPDRAPPPLPLNPQSPSSFTSRTGTSSAIQSAHAALGERARESGAALVPAYAKRVNDASPERSLVKGGSHRRMQSLQPGSVRDLSLMIEGTQSPTTSPTRSPEKRDHRPSTPTALSRENSESRARDRDSNSSTPTPGPSLTPIVRPTVRRPQSILGENTPPQSSTMLALQNMPSQSSLRDSDPPLSNITNGSTPAKGPQSLDGISIQILSLTNIATALQKEMQQLSRRSKDNATDLLSLKEATNTRDEDIRKSLRDLLGNVSEGANRLTGRDPFGGLFLDNKPHNASPAPNGRQFQLPRIPSPKTFSDSIDRGSMNTPSPSNADAAASLVLLEKIIREMGTKEGQDSLLDRLDEVSERLTGLATSSKIDDLARFVRSQSENAVVKTHQRNPSFDQGSLSRELELERPGNGGPMTQRVEHLLNNGDSRRSSAPVVRGSELLNDDLIKIIRSVKDSVAQGGGLTAEVKALVRELRGEVLGMGRELGKRLEQVEHSGPDERDSPSKDDVSRVIDEGLEQMKDQLNHVLREHRRQSAASATSQKTVVDYQEIYNAMRAALRDNEASRDDMPDLSRDDVIEAVREAWENYKPEIEVQQMGLEREEVLACLQEGLQDYAPRSEQPAGASREEVFKAVVEGLKHFVPPQMDTSATLSRDEIIEAVRDCLEEFEFPVAASAIGTDMTRAEMVHAVKEGLNDLDLPRGGAVVSTADNMEVLSRLEDIMSYMQQEFKAVSEESKDNVAANGRDTEQVLDATKDGLENLRVAIESYVDRASGAAGQEEFMDGLLKSMDDFKDELSVLVSQATDTSREQLQTELEGLREVVNSSMVPATPQAAIGNNKEVLEALQNGVNSLRQEILRPRQDTGEILDALNEGLNELRAGIDRMAHKPVDLTANDEILDALKSGLDSVRSDIETLRDASSDRAVAAVANVDDSVAQNAVVPADMLKQDDIKNLEVLITQLRIKVEAMEPESDAHSVGKDDLSRLEDILRNVQQGVEEIGSREPPEPAQPAERPKAADDAASREDVEAIETILRNTKARLDDLIDGEQAVRKEHLDVVETLVLETRESMSSVTEQLEAISRKEDVTALEGIIGQIALGFDEMKKRVEEDSEDAEKVTKTDVEAVETVVLEIKTALDGFMGTDFASISNKEDVANLETIVKEAKEKLDEYAEVSTKAFEERQAEIVGVSDRVTEVKTFLEEFQDTIKGKLEDGTGGVEALGKLLESMGEKMDKNETVGDDLKEMFETMKTEFENSRDLMTGAKIESDEKLQEAADTIGTKIDDKITELIAKYDEFQTTLDEKSKAGEARDIETEAAVVGTKAVADELKLLIDTLGSTVTDSLEKMEEASKTVFSRVEDLVSRTDENHSDHKTEHQQTRDQIQHALTAVEGLQGEVNNYQPQILQAVKDVLLLVGEHFEHSKTSTSDIQDRIVEVKPTEQAMLPPPDKYDDSEVREKLNHLVEQKYDDSEIREKLTQLAEQKYDDAGLHEKLDKLVDHNTNAEKAFSQLESLDKVHESVVKTAAEISEFLSTQTQRIADDHEDREKTLQDTNIALERRLAERDHLEASILSLKDEEDRLRSNVVNLRTEQESLIRQKTRLTGDVSSLETAMRLRKEELSEMESRAEGLERRILEGVMDHSRVLLMNKTTKGKDAMNRKRVKKPTFEESERSVTPRPVVNMALTAKRNLASPAQTGTPRRIVSLSQMNNNVPSGGMKRSQSVRTPAAKAMRKRSWGGDLAKGFGEADKENQGVGETLEELEEPDTAVIIPDGDHLADENESILDADDQGSDTGTLRRSSQGTTVMTGSSGLYTESEGGYSEYDDTGSEWTESVVGGRSSMAGTEVGGDNEIVVYGE